MCIFFSFIVTSEFIRGEMISHRRYLRSITRPFVVLYSCLPIFYSKQIKLVGQRAVDKTFLLLRGCSSFGCFRRLRSFVGCFRRFCGFGRGSGCLFHGFLLLGFARFRKQDLLPTSLLQQLRLYSRCCLW